MQKQFSFTILILLLAIVPFQSSCTSTKLAKLLDQHNRALSLAATGNASPEEKLDLLAQTFVSVLGESIRYTNPKKTVKHVTRFSNQNEKSINTLTKDLSKWMGGLSGGQKLMLAGKIAQKPYAGELLSVIPKFERKVKRKIATFNLLSDVKDVLVPKF